MKNVYEILKSYIEFNMEYNIAVAVRKTLSEKEEINYLEIYNSLAEKSFVFFSKLHLIIYEKNKALFLKIFYQQRKLIKERRIFDVDVNQVDLSAIIFDFLGQLSPGNFKECQGSVLGSAHNSENVFIEQADTGVVYRSRECPYLVISNDKYRNQGNFNNIQVCQPCMKLFYSTKNKNNFQKTVVDNNTESLSQETVVTSELIPHGILVSICTGILLD